MSDSHSIEERAGFVADASAVLVAGGVITFALFPFLLPIVLLTIVFTAPMLLLGLPFLVLGGAIYALVALWRRVRRGGRTGTHTVSREHATRSRPAPTGIL